MGDTKLLHANHESEQNNEEGKPASSLLQQQKNGVFFLQEVLAMNNYHTKHGRVIQPWEIGTMLQ